MAKTVFSNGNPGLGVEGTVVTAEFLNSGNNHHHTGRDIDGEGALMAALAGGSANALTAGYAPSIAAHIAYMPRWIRAVASNTGAATFNPDAAGAVEIRRNGSPLIAGDIRSGGVYCLIYDGSYYQLAPSPATLIADGQPRSASATPGANQIPVLGSGGSLSLPNGSHFIGTNPIATLASTVAAATDATYGALLKDGYDVQGTSYNGPRRILNNVRYDSLGSSPLDLSLGANVGPGDIFMFNASVINAINISDSWASLSVSAAPGSPGVVFLSGRTLMVSTFYCPSLVHHPVMGFGIVTGSGVLRLRATTDAPAIGALDMMAMILYRAV